MGVVVGGGRREAGGGRPFTTLSLCLNEQASNCLAGGSGARKSICLRQGAKPVSIA
jgi:hypothetical protein